jgi:hypothetical protein
MVYTGDTILFEQYLQNSDQSEFKLEKVTLPFGLFGIRISHNDGNNAQGFAVSGDVLQNTPLED